MNPLAPQVLAASEANTWHEAISEWHVVGCHDNMDSLERCLCGHEGIRYEYIIENRRNGNRLSPIGSTCIMRFEDESLTDEVELWMQSIKLLQAFREQGSDALKHLSSEHFSRRLIEFLYDRDAFEDNEWNDWDAWNDYQFLLKMFNKRNPMTEAQGRKVYMILKTSVFPWLVDFEKELHTT